MDSCCAERDTQCFHRKSDDAAADVGNEQHSDQKGSRRSSLLTSFRTIAGSIGSAVFVGIMTAVSEGSAAAYGEGALMHGMNIAFLCMAAGSVILLLISVFGVRKENICNREGTETNG